MAEQQTTDASQPIPAAAVSSDPGMAATQAWMAKQAAKAVEAAPEEKPEQEPAPKPEQKAEQKAEEKPAGKGAKAVADALLGKKSETKADAKTDASGWDETATRSLNRIGLRADEIEDLAALRAEKPWLDKWLGHLQKLQSKQDADYAALKAARADDGTREPTPGARGPSAHQQGDQPGSGQVAELFDQLTDKLGVEIGDENATLLRRTLEVFASQYSALEQKLDGYTRGVQEERQAAEIETMAQRARLALREDFPWLTEDDAFESVAVEMGRMRPDEITPEGVMESMRKAARIVGYDRLLADKQAVASKLDNKRKTRLAETAPNGSSADEGTPLSEWEISQGIIARQLAGEPRERISSWAQAQHERRRKAAR